MTTINVGSVLRVRATFRDGGRPFDPQLVTCEATSGGNVKRMSTRSGDVTREAIGVYSAQVASGDGPLLVVKFSDGRELAVEQRFDVIPHPLAFVEQTSTSMVPDEFDIGEQARAQARASLARDAEFAAEQQREIDLSQLADEARANAREQLRIDQQEREEFEKQRKRQDEFRNRVGK